jgi:hypothetical protein
MKNHKKWVELIRKKWGILGRKCNPIEEVRA